MAKHSSQRARKKKSAHSQQQQAARAADHKAAAAAAENGAAASAGPQDDFSYFPPGRGSLWPSEILKNATQPYRLVVRDWQQELPHLAMVFFLVLLLYGFTTPHRVTLEDDGLFIANMEFFGVAHPPGYPVHTFLGGIFYHLLPFGSPAFRGHLFSGFAGAVSCAAIYACIAMLVRGRVFAYLGGLGYGASKTFWSQAIIAEVYTLNAAFFFVTLALCILYSSQAGHSGRRHRRLLHITAFVYGLGMANHYPLLFLGSTGLVLLVLSQLLRNMLPNFITAAGALILGALPPYLWMVWRSFDLTPANFYGPIETFENFKFYVLRSGYSGVDTQSGVGLEDKLVFAAQLAEDMLWQFTPLGFLFAALGVAVMLRSRYSWMGVSLIVSWFTSSVLLVYLLDFKAAYIWLAAFRVYHLLAYGIMAIWMALGAAWAADRLKALPALARRQAGGVLLALIVGGSVVAHWEVNNRRDYRWAHDLAVAKIDSIEPNAVVFTFDDLDLPVGYLHFVEGMRPDLTVFNDQGLVYGNRLFSPLVPDYPPASRPNSPNKAAILRAYIDQTTRPIYYHSQRRELYSHPNYGSDFMGFLRRVNRAGPQDRVVLSDSLRHWLNDNIHLGDEITDLWTRQQHYSTVSQLVGAILLASFHGFALSDGWREVIDRAREKNAQTRLVTNSQYLAANRMGRRDMQRELEWFRTYDIDSEELLDERSKSSFFVLRADIVRRLTGVDDPEYKQSLLEGLARMESHENPALSPLVLLYSEKEQYCDIIALTERFYPNADNIPSDMLRRVRLARQRASNCAAAADSG